MWPATTCSNSEAVLSGNLERTTCMLDGLQAEGVAEVLVHWTLAEDIRNLQRARAALDAGEPLPLVLRQLRIWGKKEQLCPTAAAPAPGAPGQAAAGGPPGRWHRQGPGAARLARPRLASLAPAGV